MNRRQRQLEIDFRGWGGRRAGAGRPRTVRSRVAHRRREPLASRFPAHITLKIRRHLASLRTKRKVSVVRAAVAAACEGSGFRVVNWSIQTDHIHLLFNNAGVGGGGSFVSEDREEWDRTFEICWGGVYYTSRAFLPMLMASPEGHVINTSSVNGFWASLGPGSTHSAYSAAKFAVKGFTEALVTDFRHNAPHVKVSVVMPGHIGTSIAINSGKVMGKPGALELSAEDIVPMRARIEARGMDLTSVTDDQIREMIKAQGENFRDNAPTTAGEAAAMMLQGVKVIV